MRLSKTGLILLLAAGHGLNDFLAGYFLGSLVQINTNLFQVATGLLLYNCLAFGGQYPFALLLEKTGETKRWLQASYIINSAAAGLFVLAPHLSIVLAGVASAIYHVAGGSVCAKENKATHIGWFAAPGVAGLIAGGYFAYEKFDLTESLFAAALLFLLLLSRVSIDKKMVVTKKEPVAGQQFTIDRHDIIMILLLAAISLRSVIWNVFQFIHEKDYYWLITIAAAAFMGKIAGGWIADKIGWRLYAISSIMLATPLLTFFRKEIWLFCIGVGLLQSGIPATTSLLIHSMKGKTERGIGLSFGAAIIFGAIIFYTPLGPPLFSNAGLWVMAGLILAMLLLSHNTKQLWDIRR